MRPMKCESVMDKQGVLHLDKVTFPKLGSFKYDGNRCYVEDGIAKSSSGKPIRNNYIREQLSCPLYEGFDGEIIVGSPTAKDVRRATSSGVSAFGGEPDFTFFVFDYWPDKDTPFFLRLETPFLECHNKKDSPGYRAVFVEQTRINNLDELVAFEAKALALGYEGVVLADPEAPYKEGRSTLKQNWRLKLKRFIDAEAVIIGQEELMHNDNEATIDEHGYTKRSSHKDNKRGAGVMGALIVRDLKTGVEFKVGTGFSAADRELTWNNGDIITYKHFPIGAKDKPNIPSFVSVRCGDDLAPNDAENPFA